jgi:hypothetical protein
VEGVKFHLYGTSLSGLAVDEYAVTDKNGLAKFENVLISGSTPIPLKKWTWLSATLSPHPRPPRLSGRK